MRYMVCAMWYMAYGMDGSPNRVGSPSAAI